LTILQLVFESIYLYLPAYFANASPVVLGGGEPLDRGLKWKDGRPILGSHKTIRGTFAGITIGTLVGLIQLNSVGGFLQATGAITGDLIVSFIKRRIKMEPGESLPIADQLDFIAFAVFYSYPIQHTGLDKIAAIMLVTIPIHYAVNFIAWLLKLKENPW
jgi:CDP-2,3-bis-(O-geranylgeranyl)-sn-glycerol synthase